MHTIAFQITAHTPPIQPHICSADARWTRVSFSVCNGLAAVKSGRVRDQKGNFYHSHDAIHRPTVE